MLHITSHYHNFIIIYTACLAHLNAYYIHLNTLKARQTWNISNTRSLYERFEC